MNEQMNSCISDLDTGTQQTDVPVFSVIIQG